MDRFWIVLADRPQLTCTIRHCSRENAMKEAKRLAAITKDTKFFVAAVTGYAEFPAPAPQEADWHEMRKPYFYEERY